MKVNKLVNISETMEILKSLKCLDGVSLGNNRSVYSYNVRGSNLRVMITFIIPKGYGASASDKILDGYLSFLHLQHYIGSTNMKGWIGLDMEEFWNQLPDSAKEEFAFHLDLFR